MALWTLTIEGKEELTLDDIGHISELINQGFTSGELNDDDEDDEDDED